MKIPDNWQEELMLYEWKKMRVERCKSSLSYGGNWYHFPNGLRLRYGTIEVDIERARSVMDKLVDWKPRMKIKKKKGIAAIKVDWERYKLQSEGELEDFRWRIYSLDV
jgi:hypothetical protein